MRVRHFIDFDGVLADLDWAGRAWVRDRYNVTLTEASHNQWSFNEAYGFPRSHNAEFWSYVWSSHHKLYDGATRFLGSLRGEVHIFTVRPYGDARQNFERNFRRRLAATVAEVHLFDTWQQKERFVTREKPDFVLEDNIEFLLKMPPTAGTQLFLLDRPWNQSADLSDHYTRVQDYGEYLERTHAKSTI